MHIKAETYNGPQVRVEEKVPVIGQHKSVPIRTYLWTRAASVWWFVAQPSELVDLYIVSDYDNLSAR